MHQAYMRAELATDKASYAHSDQAQIAVSVTDGTGPVAGVVVRAAVTNANGMRLAGESVTDADGVASLSYKIDTERDGSGTYIVDLIASKFGFEPAGGSTTFEVRSA